MEVDIVSTTTPQLQIQYDASNYANFSISAGGDLTIAPSGGDLNITGNLAVSGNITGTLAPSTITVSGVSTLTGNVVTSVLRQGTSDASDTGSISINGGGADVSQSRGAWVRVAGNEHSTVPGYVDIATGNIAGSLVRLFGISGQIAQLTGTGILSVGTTTTTNAAAGDARLAGALWIGDGITAPTAQTGFAAIYVDTADGDLKVKFGDGTVKTLTIDT